MYSVLCCKDPITGQLVNGLVKDKHTGENGCMYAHVEANPS